MRYFRIHVLGIPHTKTSLEYAACPFTQKALQFCKMMYQRGHYIIHYGVEGSNPLCNENVAIVDTQTYEKSYGQNLNSNLPYRMDINTPAGKMFIKNAIQEIKKRKQPGDILLPFYGIVVQDICKHFTNDMLVVEPGIGYTGCFAPFKIYESNAWRSIMETQHNTWDKPSYYDTVIPPFFDLENFPVVINKKPRTYFAFLGRIGDYKGVNIAIEIARKLNIPLKIGGQLDKSYENYPWDNLIQYIGYCNAQQRYELFSNAIAVLIPSRYMEPFGYTQIESWLCGTPIITADWGSFPEVNKEGVAGYRCNIFNDYITAALNCIDNKISPEVCRQAGEQYSLQKIAPLYEQYFEKLYTLYTTEGWYKLDEQTINRIKQLKGGFYEKI